MMMATRSRGYGKISKDLLKRVIQPRLGSPKGMKDILVGPDTGLDNAVIRLGHGKVLVGKTDPLSWIPKLGPRESAWLSIHHVASDFLTSGIRPQYAFFDFNLPPGVTDRQFREYWNSLHVEMTALGITVAGGHTGRYEGCDFTIVGGATLLGIGDERQYFVPGMAKIGDAIVVTKGAAIECTAILAKMFPKTVSIKLGRAILERSSKYFPMISVVKEAIVAVEKIGRNGGLTSLHDVEEGGLISAICEVAIASENGFSISKEKIPISEVSREICKLFGISDPYSAIGGGSLILTVNPDKSKKIVDVLAHAGLRASVVGTMEPRKNGFKIIDDPTKVRYPASDPYWKAYWKASTAGKN